MSNSYDRVASDFPTVTTEEELYVVGASAEFQGDLHIYNQSSGSVDVSVSILDATGTAGDADWILKEYSLEALTPKQITGICLGNSRTVNIQVSTGSTVSFNLWGCTTTS